MAVQQVQSGKAMPAKAQVNAVNKSTIFQKLLSSAQTPFIPGLISNNQSGANMGEGQAAGESLYEDLQSYLIKMVMGKEQHEQILNPATEESKSNKEVETLITDTLSKPDTGEMNQAQYQIMGEEILAQLSTKEGLAKLDQLTTQDGHKILDQLNEEVSKEMQKQFAEIFAKVDVLLSQIKTEQDSTKSAPKMLALLQQWSDLSKKTGNSKGMENALAVMENMDTKEAKIWQELVQTFQRREQLVSNQKYSMDAHVTTADVAKWLGNTLNDSSSLDQVFGKNPVSLSTMPQSKVEQYVIHITQTQSSGTQSADKQLMEQFQKVMKSSSFLTKPNGINQLSIALRPQNLGEMMVRLTQINGEMTVKIVVASQAAKEMLDSNMHQLRSMFSPQQVVVEKQDMNLQQAQDLQKEEQEQQLKDNQQGQSQDSDEQKKQHTEDDFEKQFRELLMNEKV